LNAFAPRLRIFAGPNGSGKSTIKDMLLPQWLGTYVNADEIETLLKLHGKIDLGGYGIAATQADISAFLAGSGLATRPEFQGLVGTWNLAGDLLRIDASEISSYHASILADFIRHRLVESRNSFTFETVMSSPAKVDFLRKAKAAGYRVYLYFIATENPEINVARVRHRVVLGGHGVPERKIVERYFRCLDLLDAAIQVSDRAYLFDSSENGRHNWIAEITSGSDLEIKTDSVPAWFRKTVLSKYDAVG
jgi:predicted ABC-type ATPase